MDYQALGLGEAASVVTAVTGDKDQHTIMISCLYDPQDVQMPYTLWFKADEVIKWRRGEAWGVVEPCTAGSHHVDKVRGEGVSTQPTGRPA
jgi:hypothetical protein